MWYKKINKETLINCLCPSPTKIFEGRLQWAPSLFPSSPRRRGSILKFKRTLDSCFGFGFLRRSTAYIPVGVRGNDKKLLRDENVLIQTFHNTKKYFALLTHQGICKLGALLLSVFLITPTVAMAAAWTQTDDGTTNTGFNASGSAFSSTVVTGTGNSASIILGAGTATNLALNKTVTCSSQYTAPTYQCSNAVDGSNSTYWQVNAGNNGWIKIDLGAAYTISQIVLRPVFGANNVTYNILTSPDNTTFTQRDTFANTQDGIDYTRNLSPAVANVRYIRVDVINGTIQWYPSFYEISVYQPTYASSGTYTSSVFDTTQASNFSTLDWTATSATTSVTTNIDYNSSTGYTFNSSQIIFSGTDVALKNQSAGGQPLEITATSNTKGLYHFNASAGAEANNEGVEMANNSTGLVAMYHMNGTIGGIANGASIADSQTNITANNGTASNANGTGMAYAAGKLANAVSLEGTDDYINVTGGYTNTIKGDDTHTIEMWVYPRSLTSLPTLYDAYQLSGYDYFLELGNAAGTIVYWGIGGGTTNYRTYSGTVLAINQWHHIVAVKTGAGNNGDLYIDGVLQQNYTNVGTGLGNTPNANSDLYFGRYRSGSYYLNGLLDEFAIYNTALTSTQVIEHYSRGRVFDAEGKGGDTGTLTIGSGGAQTTASQAWTNGNGSNAKLGGQAISLDGTDDFVSAPTASISGAITAEAWVYSANYGANMFVVQKANVNTQWELFFESGFLKWRGGSTTGIQCAAPSNSAWHHVAGTQNGTTATLYIDGAQCATGAVTAIGNGAGLIYVGSYESGYYFNGRIDEVAIYNTVLSATEISRQYNSGTGLELSGKEPGLVALWHFNDGGSSATAVDSKGDHGTITGPTSVTSNTNLDQALSFDGVNDYVSTSTNGVSGSAGTFETWLKFNKASIGANEDHVFWSIYTSATDRIYGEVESYAAVGVATPEITICFDSSSAASVCMPSGINPTDLAWHHVAGVWGDGGQLKIYVDGQLRGTPVNISGAFTVASSQLIAAYNSGSPALFFDGTMDEVAVWSSALDLATIQDHYSGGGSEYLSVSGSTVISPNTSVTGITAYTSFTETATKPANTSIDYQISYDNGSNWCNYSSGWQCSSGNAVYDAATTINSNIATFPITNATIKVKARLNTTDQNVRPLLNNIQIVYAGTSPSIDVRSGNVAVPDGTWTAWQTTVGEGASQSGVLLPSALNNKQYVQYRLNLATANTLLTPSLDSITLNYAPAATAGITVNPTSGLTTTEAGGTATFTVVLNTQPTADVVIGISSNDTTEGTVSPSSLTFTNGNWDSTQTVTITGADDAVDDGNIAYSIVTAAATSSDGNYNGLNANDVSVSNTDNDTANITVNPSSGLTTTEASGTATFTVVLTSQPTADVVIGLSSNDTTEGTVSPSSVTFTSGNWSSTQTVTITGVDDVIVDGNISYSIVTAAATSSDGNYSGLNASDVSVTNTDNDTTVITVTPTSGLTTTEAGGTATFTVVLISQPTADVVIGLTSNDTTEGTVSPSSLTFTNGNWNSSQTVTVTGVDDALDDGNIAYSIVTAAATSSDGNYNGLNASDVSVSNTDNDTAGITVNPTSGLTTTEAGGTATFSVVLDTQPTGDVVIGLSSNDTTEGTVLPSSLTFTNGNWNSTQTVTITGVDDVAIDGNIAYSIVTAAATSSDGNYNGLNASDVSVTNDDNDTPGITVNPTSGLTTTEAGGTATFTVVLVTQPTADVVIGISSNDTTEGAVSPSSVTFTNGNWNSTQTVTITGVDDDVDDGNIAYSIVTGAATSSDGNYNGLNAIDVSVSNTDNDTANITVNPASGLTTTEVGGAATFTVVLTSQPTANVVIGLSSSDATEGTVSPSSVTFTSGNWSSTQTVTITGVDDVIVDGNIAYSIVTAAATSSDGGYNGLNASDVSVTNNDNDTAAITVTPTTGLTTTEAGGTVTFTVVLTSQPTANVVIGLSSNDTTEGTVSPSSLTFTSGNWNSAQTVTATGVDDVAIDGNIAYSIATAAATSSDGNYNGVNASDVSVTNSDNDTPGITVNPTSGLTTTEAGSTATFTVVLNTQPTANVIVGLSSNDTTEGTVSPSSLTFTNGNWNSTQTVTITGVDDPVDDGNIAYSIVTAAATSSDGSYNGLNASDVSVSNTDNDTAGIAVTPTSGLTTTEAGGTATFTVVLSSQPAADVTIGLSSSDTTEGTVSPGSLTFTNGNWNSAQTVTITGVDDSSSDGNIAYSVVTAAATSSDGSYNALNASDVSVTNNDNEVPIPTVNVTAEVSNVSEESTGGGTFAVSRTGSTSASLTVNYTISGTAASGNDYATLSGTVVISSGASSATVTVAPFDDNNPESAESVMLILSSDSAYNIGNPTVATITIVDNEPRIFIRASDASASEKENNDPGTFTIFRTTNITSQLIVSFTVSGSATPDADYAALPSSITMAANVSMMTLTVTPVLDSDPEYLETVIVTIDPNTSYGIDEPATATVTIADLNVAPEVKLVAQQGGSNRRIVSTDGGNVTVSAAVSDANPGDTHTYSWVASSNAIVFTGNAAGPTRTFNPASIIPGFYTLRVRVTDSAVAFTEVDMILQVVTSLPSLSQTGDSDNDGIVDSLDGYTDGYNNGIPDYLESNTLLSNELLQSALSNTHLIKAEANLELKLGSVAFVSGRGVAKVTSDDIVNYGGDGGLPGLYTTDSVDHVGHYFDFEVTNLVEPGQSVKVVIPQYTALPANAVYRKYNHSFGWSDFVIDDDNDLASAPGSSGNCPAPGDPSYTTGLTQGHWCVQITIKDGGPNDADGATNYVIKDPGVIGGQPTVPTITISSGSGGGGGAIDLIVLTMLLLSLGMRENQRKDNRVKMKI